MKLYKISALMFSALLLASCSDIDKQDYTGGAMTGDQSQETNIAIPTRTKATFAGMFTLIGDPCHNYKTHFTRVRPDDFGFVMSAISLDLEGADMAMQDNGYNWFSPADELTSRNADYANPYVRYVIPYTSLGVANEVINSFPEDTQNEEAINMIAQAKAIRAFDYLSLAPYFQGSYQTSKDKPCVPLLDGKHDYTNNPRATVEEVYATIIEDLNYAIEHLTEARDDKSRINQNVAYGLRARAYLYMGEYEKALADAEKAMVGFTPATLAEVSVPGFNDSKAANWMWTYDLTDDQVAGNSGNNGQATASSWLCAFSGEGYGTSTQNVPVINKLLYDKIPSTDVRKGWWLDENLHSPLWANLEWKDSKSGAVLAKGDAIAKLKIKDVKEPFVAYTNIKFGQKDGIGSQKNVNSWPLMRVEEMILIQAECYANIAGQEAKAKEVLTNFVKTYRNPSYTIPTTRTLKDEIWFQRRVELWGEGFYTADARRLGKPIVRFHGKGTTNFADAYAFNIKNDEGWLNLRFPQTEKDTNAGIIDNTEGNQPQPGDNPTLRDGVTD